MKVAPALFFCVCLLLAATISSVKGRHKGGAVTLDQAFDSYGDIRWKDEMAHLDNFAIALQHDGDSIGYIIVYAGRRACVGEAKDRALRAKKYVVNTRGIQESRIKWIDGGIERN